MKITYKLGLLVCSTIVTFSSCKKWLDIQPQQNIKSETLFQDPEGFESALIGCYDLLQDGNLYKGGLTYGYLSNLEQRFDNNRIDQTDKQIGLIYDFKNNNSSKQRIAQIWSSTFEVMVNINNLIEYLDKKGNSVLKDKQHATIKSEVYGLRALLYFNLLRLWGPVYSINPDLPTAPYRTEPTDEKLPLLAAKDLAQQILADLDTAEASYMASRNKEEEMIAPLDELMKYRMNIYAIKGLKAEVYQWIGDNANALKYANEVIDKSGLLLVRDTQSDPVFWGETLFGLNIYNFYESTKSIFPTNTAAINERNSPALYTFRLGIQEVFEVAEKGNSDIRYKYKEGFINEGDKYILRKFMNLDNLSIRDIVPVIRLSNMYLIKAECGSEEDFVNSINTLWDARGIRREYKLTLTADINQDKKLNILNKEYAKEYFGEGQWWYFLKRNNMTTFYRAPENMDMSQHYIFPIPDAEKEHGLGNRDKE